MIEIVPFQSFYQKGVSLLMSEIELEFQEPISVAKSGIEKIIFDGYWIAIHENVVVGTISIIRIGQNNSVLKNLFLSKKFRGVEVGAAKLLLDTVVQWCQEERISNIFLGTMIQFRAAQRFYTKNGFQEIHRCELPLDFLINPIDGVFYKKSLLV